MYPITYKGGEERLNFILELMGRLKELAMSASPDTEHHRAAYRKLWDESVELAKEVGAK